MKKEKTSILDKDIESYRFEDEQELSRLYRSIQLAEKYFLFFAICNQIPRQNQLITRIKKELPDYKIQIVKFNKPVESLLDELRRKIKNKKPDAVFVQGLRYSIPSGTKAKQTSFIADLNISRDSFPKLLSCPLVLWLPEYAMSKVMNGAPDFSSVRSGTFYFETDEKVMQRQISQALTSSYGEHTALRVEERQQRIEYLWELLREYKSLPFEKRNTQTEHELKDKLADLYYKIADYAKAEELRIELLNNARSQKEEKEISLQLNELGLIYIALGKYDVAIDKYEEAQQIDEKIFGKNHPNHATLLNNLGHVYYLQGRQDEAINRYKEALRIGEKTQGKEHLDHAIRLNNLANVYKDQGRYDEAIEAYRESLRIIEKTVGKEHTNYASNLNNLANVYQNQGKYDEAIQTFNKALQIDEKTIGKEHPDHATRLSNLAMVYEEQGKYEQALNLYKEVLDIEEKVFPNKHPYILQDRKSLERVRKKMMEN